MLLAEEARCHREQAAVDASGNITGASIGSITESSGVGIELDAVGGTAVGAVIGNQAEEHVCSWGADMNTAGNNEIRGGNGTEFLTNREFCQSSTRMPQIANPFNVSPDCRSPSTPIHLLVTSGFVQRRAQTQEGGRPLYQMTKVRVRRLLSSYWSFVIDCDASGCANKQSFISPPEEQHVTPSGILLCRHR